LLISLLFTVYFHLVSQFYYHMMLCRARLCDSKLSVCPFVVLRYGIHTGWNTSKIISWPNSLRLLLRLTPTWAIWCHENTPKIKLGWNRGGVRSTKNLQYLRNRAR